MQAKMCYWERAEKKIYAEYYQKAQDTKNKCKQKMSQIVYPWEVPLPK